MQAASLAAKYNLTLVPREKLTIRKLQQLYRTQDVLVVSSHGLQCYRGDEKPLFFHPGSAVFRIKRLLSGKEHDPMLRIPEVRAGDRIVDCTAGLCADAITFAYAVGETGSVTAIEKDPVVSLLVREGLAAYDSEVPEINEAMRRITVIQGDHLQVLRSMPDDSADVVYFDPMFRTPVHESSGISALRQFAYEAPLTEAAVREACRVARRVVVLKELRASDQFARLGFVSDSRQHAKIAYGVIRINEQRKTEAARARRPDCGRQDSTQL